MIAFDNFTDGGDNGGTTNSLTYSHVFAANSIGFIGVQGGNIGSEADDISSVTCGGLSCTLIDKITTDPYGGAGGQVVRYNYLYYIDNPGSGSKSIVITAGSNHYILSGTVSYTGASNTGIPDNSTKQQSSLYNSASLATSLTTVADNCWTVLFIESFDGLAPGAGSGSTLRGYGNNFGNWALFDSNGPISPAGSYSMTTTQNSGSAAIGISHIMASFKIPVSMTLILMGDGLT